MNKITKLLLGFVVIFVGVSKVSPVSAANLTVVCANDGPCTPANAPAFFNESNWVPGDEITKTIEINNNDTNDSCNLVFDTKNETQAPTDFGTRLSAEIKEGVINWYSDSLSSLFSVGPISLGSVPSGGTRNFDWTITFDSGAGNEFQRAQTIFDFDLAFECLESSTPSLGTISGFSTAGTPVCGATVPTNTPYLSVSSAGPNSMSLVWTTVSPMTHYMIRYGLAPGNYIYGASNVGNITEFLVEQLSGGTRYYFQVAGVNDCASGPWSNEASIVPLGVTLVEQAAPGFIEQELGASTEATPSPSPEAPEVKGVESSTCNNWFPWWIPLVFQLVLTGLYLFIRRREVSLRRILFIPAIFAVLSYIVHLIIGCPCENVIWIDKWCFWYWLFDIIILAGGLLVYKFLLQKKPDKE